MKAYFNQYYHFTSSYYFTDGLRITSAVIIPILLFANFGYTSTGIAFAVGTMFTSLADLPGPSNERRAGVFTTIALIFAINIIIGFSASVPWLLAIELLVFSFFFSMLGIYGARSSSIGLVTMFIIIVNLEDDYTTKQILVNGLMGLLGGCWYFIWSVALYNTRPYRLARQATGDYLLALARYLELNADFYNAALNDKSVYKALFNSQTQIYNKQNLAREILYNKYRSKNESGPVANIALVGFVEAREIFNRIIAAQREYRVLYNEYSPDAKKKYKEALQLMAAEMHKISIHIQKGKNKTALTAVAKSLKKLEQYFNIIDPLKNKPGSELKKADENSLRSFTKEDIIHNDDVHRLYSPENIQYSKQILEKDHLDTQHVKQSAVQLFLDNLHFQSDYFRHALRLTISVFIGYIITGFLPFDHKYWVLITVIVILKPTYQLSRRRNFYRLAGTFIGAAAAIAILFVVRNNAALIAVITVSMIAAFSLMRIQYFFCTLFVTIYMVIGLHLLNSGNLNTLAMDRVIDTLIGSAISFLLVVLIPLVGENGRTRKILIDVIESNKKYAEAIEFSPEGEISVNPQHEILRKEVSNQLSNLTDAFQRLQYAPHSHQEKMIIIYRCMTVHNLLFTHLSMLISELIKNENKKKFNQARELLQGSAQYLSDAAQILASQAGSNKPADGKKNDLSERPAMQWVADLTEESVDANDLKIQFRYIYSISAYLKKLTAQL